MMIPSIDIAGGQTVQLIGGREHALSAGDPLPLAQRFGRIGPIAVIDLDAAMSKGNNAAQIRRLLPEARCRVGGGIRDVETAIGWLDAGAEHVILGTAANPELLRELPKQRVIAALDAMHADAEEGAVATGEVVDEGWTRRTGAAVLDRVAELRDYVDGFLITFVEREGRLTGIDLPTVEAYVAAAAPARVTIAGGVATTDQIAALDRVGADAQVGMALYTDRISLAEGFCSVLTSDRPDELWPTVVANRSGETLGLAYSNLESVSQSLETGEVHYWSRKRGLWKKGGTSGATQTLHQVDVDCDRDALLFTVHQHGVGFCHLEQPTCFGQLKGMEKLQSRLVHRRDHAVSGSYSKKLFESPELLASKIMEEAGELCEAQRREDVIHEAADVVFFTLARMVKEGIDWYEIQQELDRRALRVTRRN